MQIASLTLTGGVFKALVSAYRQMGHSEFYWFFDDWGLHARPMGVDYKRMMDLTITSDYWYESEEERIWVWGAMELLYGKARDYKKGEEVRLELREDGFYLDDFKAGSIIPEAEVDRDTFDPPETKLYFVAHLEVLVPTFARMIRNAERDEDLGYVLLDLRERKGTFIFFSKAATKINSVEVTDYEPWILSIEERATAAYDLSLLDFLLSFPYRAGLTETVEMSIGKEGVAQIKYEEELHYTLKFWLGPVVVEAELLERVLRPPPEKELLFTISDKDVVEFQRLLRAVNDLSYGAMKLALLADCYVYWPGGYVKISPAFFTGWSPPEERLSFVFEDAGRLATFLNDVEALRGYFVEEEGERRFLLEGSGPKIGLKTMYADEIEEKVEIPEIRREPILEAPTRLMKQALEDAEVAEDVFLLVYATPYTIEMIGRDEVYYEATHPLDGFKTIEEGYVPITARWFKPLASLCGHIPTATVTLGRVDDDIYVEAGDYQWSLRASLYQYPTDVEPAAGLYRELVEEPPKPVAAPEVEPLPVAPPVEAPPPPPVAYETVYFLREVPAFTGFDGKRYGPFKKGDEARLPRVDAETHVKTYRASYMKPYVRPPPVEVPPPPPVEVPPPEVPPPPEEPSLGELYLKYYHEALARHRAEAAQPEEPEAEEPSAYDQYMKYYREARARHTEKT